MAAGATIAASETWHDALGLLIPDDESRRQVLIIENQSQRYRELSSRFLLKLQNARSHKQALLDTVVVGGETVGAYAVFANVSSDVQIAYELAYPNVAAVRSFSDQVNHLNVQE